MSRLKIELFHWPRRRHTCFGTTDGGVGATGSESSDWGVLVGDVLEDGQAGFGTGL